MVCLSTLLVWLRSRLAEISFCILLFANVAIAPCIVDLFVHHKSWRAALCGSHTHPVPSVTRDVLCASPPKQAFPAVIVERKKQKSIPDCGAPYARNFVVGICHKMIPIGF